MLHCVFYKKRIIGMFHSQKEAVNYIIDCWLDGKRNMEVKSLTEKKYRKYLKKMLKRG